MEEKKDPEPRGPSWPVMSLEPRGPSPSVISSEDPITFYSKVFSTAVQSQDILVMCNYWKRVIVQGVEFADREHVTSNAMKTALSLDNTEVANWVFALRPAPKVSQAQWRSAFGSACADGRFNMVKWIWVREGELPFLWGGLHKAAYGNHITIVHWLWDILSDKKIYAERLLPIFRNACLNGDLDLAKWVWDLNLISGLNVSLHSCAEMAASGGHADIIQWLETIGVDASNGPDKGRMLFLCASSSENLDLAMYTFKKGSFEKHEALATAILDGRFGPTTRWLEDEYEKITEKSTSKSSSSESAN